MKKKQPSYMMTAEVVNFLKNTDILFYPILDEVPNKETMTLRQALILCNKQYTENGKKWGYGKKLFRKLESEVITYVPSFKPHF
jgi:hypothetical protein